MACPMCGAQSSGRPYSYCSCGNSVRKNGIWEKYPSQGDPVGEAAEGCLWLFGFVWAILVLLNILWNWVTGK